MKEQQQQAEQAHRIISKLYLRLTRVPCALVMFTARLRPCHVCPEDGHPFSTSHTPADVGCCVLCAIFGAFPADLCKTVAFFNCIFTRPAGPAVAAPPVVLPLPRSVSPRFASTVVRPEFALFAACLCKCVRSIQFSHICATLLSNVQHIATLIVVVLVLLCC